MVHQTIHQTKASHVFNFIRTPYLTPSPFVLPHARIDKKKVKREDSSLLECDATG